MGITHEERNTVGYVGRCSHCVDGSKIYLVSK